MLILSSQDRAQDVSQVTTISDGTQNLDVIVIDPLHLPPTFMRYKIDELWRQSISHSLAD